MHETVEQGYYPYRCSRCGECFLCGHKLLGYEFWVCSDGYKKPTRPDPGVTAKEGIL